MLRVYDNENKKWINMKTCEHDDNQSWVDVKIKSGELEIHVCSIDLCPRIIDD